MQYYDRERKRVRENFPSKRKQKYGKYSTKETILKVACIFNENLLLNIFARSNSIENEREKIENS
jgi:hypothetical protein